MTSLHYLHRKPETLIIILKFYLYSLLWHFFRKSPRQSPTTKAMSIKEVMIKILFRLKP